VYTNLFHLLPLEVGKEEITELVEGTSKYVSGREREDLSNDEFAFLLTLSRYITIFEKAKAMLVANRFTVEFKGSKDTPVLDLNEFEIIPVKLKEECPKI